MAHERRLFRVVARRQPSPSRGGRRLFRVVARRQPSPSRSGR